jgi:hypothetical protein
MEKVTFTLSEEDFFKGASAHPSLPFRHLKLIVGGLVVVGIAVPYLILRPDTPQKWMILFAGLAVALTLFFMTVRTLREQLLSIYRSRPDAKGPFTFVPENEELKIEAEFRVTRYQWRKFAYYEVRDNVILLHMKIGGALVVPLAGFEDQHHRERWESELKKYIYG